mgnify:FL=1
MNVNNENKLQELSLYVNINLNNMNIQKQQNAKTYNKDNNSLNNINKIKRKVNIMNYNQRELQNRISDIQVQEAKIDEMEKTLQNAKNIYSENIKNEKKESSNIKVKIKQLAKKEDELNLKSYEEINSKNTDNKLEDERIISIIEETLKKIDQVKNQIAIYKSKLMILEDSVDKAVSKLSSNKDSIQKDFINEELGFISIENNIETGILINIAI